MCVDNKQQRLKNNVTWGWCLLKRMSVQWFYPVADAMNEQNNSSTLHPLDCNSGQDVASVYTHPTMSHPPTMIIVRNSHWVNLISQNISSALETTAVGCRCIIALKWKQRTTYTNLAMTTPVRSSFSKSWVPSTDRSNPVAIDLL